MVNARGHLWVTDFGLARFQGDSSLTAPGDLVGTLRYMSPEQATADHAVVDQRTDVYSLGTTLYELATLHPVFAGSDRQEILRRIPLEEPRRPRAVRPDVPRNLETIVLKAMAKDPDRVRALIAQARQTSATALTELRDLVRGIHPPVLAERGLSEAVRAVALDTPVPVTVTTTLTGRTEAPIETAAYFAVCEALANAVRHAEAQHIEVTIEHDNRRLSITVTDDGRGGADAGSGTGLPGVQRRLATFDGMLRVTSPPGGPTVLAIEIPCALVAPA